MRSSMLMIDHVVQLVALKFDMVIISFFDINLTLTNKDIIGVVVLMDLGELCSLTAHWLLTGPEMRDIKKLSTSRGLPLFICNSIFLKVRKTRDKVNVYRVCQ